VNKIGSTGSKDVEKEFEGAR